MPCVHSTAALVRLDFDALDETNSEEIWRRLSDFGSKLAMHIVAASPLFVSRESVPSAVLEKEKAILLEEIQHQASKSNTTKPPAMVQKMVEGRLNKFFEQTVLPEQQFMIVEQNEKSRKVSALLASFPGVAGLRIGSFVRFHAGEPFREFSLSSG